MANNRAKERIRSSAISQSSSSRGMRTARAIRTRKAPVNYAEPDSDSDGDARAKKRARNKRAESDAPEGEGQPVYAVKGFAPHRKVLRGKAGSLAAMRNMPLDIVNNILEYLGPQDLLNLTRTSKEFRSLLLDKSYARLWKNSFQHVDGLPECPPHMSAPAYANLVFSAHCHNCLKANSHSVLWEFGVRYCGNCKEELIANYLPSDMSWIEHKAPELLCSIIINHRRFYHRPQVDEFIAASKSLAKGDEETFLAEQKARIEPIKDHARLCHKWSEEQAKLRAEARDDIREARLQAIIDRLREEGYSEELDIMSKNNYKVLSAHKHARQPNRLTERAWQLMKEDLINIMKAARNKCLAEQHEASMLSRLTYIKEELKLLPESFPRSAESQCGPTFVDLVFMTEFRDLVEAPGEDKGALEALKVLLPRVPELVKYWKEDARCQLLNLVKKCVNIKEVPEGIDPLQLATIWFQCKGCTTAMEYPTVVAHRCSQSSHYQNQTPDGEEFRRAVRAVAEGYRWPVGSLTCNTLLHKRTQMMIKTCGKDPIQTTKQDMDNLNERFRCQPLDRSGTQLIMSWRAALFKLDQPGYENDTEDAWQVIAATERAKVDELEYNYLPALLDAFQSNYRCKWSCTQCNKGYNATRCELRDVKTHVQKEHGIKDPSIEKGNIFLDACAKHRVPITLPVHLISRSLPFESLTNNDKALLREGRASFYNFPA